MADHIDQFPLDNTVRNTLRLDFDGTGIRGDWSHYNLNGDDGVRAEDSGVDYQGVDGIDLTSNNPEELADAASEWFEHHKKRWVFGDRRRRRD